MVTETHRLQKVLPIITLAGSLLLGLALIYAWLAFQSNLALALAADSIVDVFTAGVLAWSVHIASQPQDNEHPFGHSRAEPIAALVVAVIACVVAIEVARSAVSTLTTGTQMQPSIVLAALFGAKLLFKLVIWLIIFRTKSKNPSLRALMFDSRNDVFVSALALIGFGLAFYDYKDFDAWLALPVSVGIALSGISLARENIRLLMGEAPDEKRQKELELLADSVAGIEDVHDLRAQYLGTQIQVHLHIVVDENLTVKQAHDIGENVQALLEAEHDVGHAFVHIDIEKD